MTYSWTIISFETRDVVNDAAASLADAVVSVKWKRDGVDSLQRQNRGAPVLVRNHG